VADDLHVLQDVMRCVQEETGGHTIKAGSLLLCAVHLHKVPSTHGQQAWPLHQGCRMHIRNGHLQHQAWCVSQGRKARKTNAFGINFGEPSIIPDCPGSHNEVQKGKQKTAHAFGVNSMRSQVLHRAAQALTMSKREIIIKVSIEL